MRTAILLGFPANGKPVLIAGPEVPISEQIAEMKRLRGTTEHESFSRIELWTSDEGLRNKVRFNIKPKSKKQAQKTSSPRAKPPEENPAPAVPSAAESGDAEPTDSAPDDEGPTLGLPRE